jgi:hypothetical protein
MWAKKKVPLHRYAMNDESTGSPHSFAPLDWVIRERALGGAFDCSFCERGFVSSAWLIGRTIR